MNTTRKKRALDQFYISPSHFTLECFQLEFDQKMFKTNNWIVLADLIPWDKIRGIYINHVLMASIGRGQLIAGERNPAGDFYGKSKTAYGLNLIQARLKYIASVNR